LGGTITLPLNKGGETVISPNQKPHLTKPDKTATLYLYSPIFGSMMQTRTKVRLLKYLGIALFAIPEPVSTAFGAAFFLTAYHWSQKLESSLDTLSTEYLLPWQSEGSRSLGSNLSPWAGQAQRDRRDEVVYHTLDLPRLYRRYGMTSTH
jgi:hypothetical protein